MIYGINERPPIKKMLVFGLQLLLSIWVATVLIAKICGVATSGSLIGASLSTLSYILITRGKSPMVLSNSGALVAPVMFALGVAGYTGVAIGGSTACIIYSILGLIFTKIHYENVYKVFPHSLIGSVTAVIGLNLMSYIPGYIGDTGAWGIVVAMITMLAIALIAHYAKGLARILPFLLGTLIGYVISVILTLTGACQLIDFSMFANMKLFSVPDLAFTHWTAIDWSTAIPIVIMFVAYTISASMEALSDHAALGGIIGVDLYRTPGLGKIFFGEGVGNLISACVGGLGSCSYGEGVATVGFSRVASVWVTATAAVMLGLLGFIEPIQVFIASIPSCVFAGAAMILYGFIACSGVKMLQKVDLNVQKNLIITSVVLSLGICGIVIGGSVISFSGTALALIVGVVLNIILKENKEGN